MKKNPNQFLVLTVSDSNGTIYEENGIDEERWNFICELKNVKRGRLVKRIESIVIIVLIFSLFFFNTKSEYAEKFSSAKYTPNSKPWTTDCKADVAMPCATQVISFFKKKFRKKFNFKSNQINKKKLMNHLE